MYVYIYIYTYMYTYIHVYIYIYIYLYESASRVVPLDERNRLAAQHQHPRVIRSSGLWFLLSDFWSRVEIVIK